MKGLVYRELYLCRWLWLVIAGLYALDAVLMILRPGRDLTSQIGGSYLTYLYFYATFSVHDDERSGWARFAAALPQGRDKMVRGKYLTSLLGLVLVLAGQLLLAGLAAGLGRQTFFSALQVGLYMLLWEMCVLAVSFPVLYTFGSIAANLLIIGGSWWASGALRPILKAVQNGTGLSEMVIGVVICLLSLGAFRLSYAITRSIVEQKEF